MSGLCFPFCYVIELIMLMLMSVLLSSAGHRNCFTDEKKEKCANSLLYVCVYYKYDVVTEINL